MAESPDQIRQHIAVLSDFEDKFGEYVVARHNRELEGQHHWTGQEWSRRERELRMLAPRADAAIEASGVGGIALYGPPAIGSPFIADDLASLIFHVEDRGFGERRDEALLRQILDRLPTQIAGLEMELEKADAQVGRGWSRKLPKIATARIGWVPPTIGFIVDVAGFVALIALAVGFVGNAL